MANYVEWEFKVPPRKTRATPFKRLQKRLEEELGIKAERFERTYAGYWMQSQGAFKWTAVVDGFKEIGSMYTATELLKAKQLRIEPDGEILICEIK